jgi:transcriptional regulator
MYIPPAFRVDSHEQLYAFMAANNFATLITVADGAPYATHLPVMIDRTRGEQGYILAHIAKANPQWQHFATGQEVLLIFHGPHAYVSPSWYASDFAVPTWNYVAVHVYGCPRLIDDPATVQQMLTDLVDLHEAPMESPWTFAWTEKHIHLTKAIVAFELEIRRVEGKAKLSQNRPLADQQGATAALSQSQYDLDRQVAALMAENQTTIARQPI